MAVDYIVDNQAMLAATSGCVNEVVVKNLCARYSEAWYNKQLVHEQLKGCASQEPPKNVAAAYIGVTRTDKAANAIRGVILYKLDDNTANRTSMFVQRRDGSVKPSAEITGGFIDATQKVGNLSIDK